MIAFLIANWMWILLGFFILEKIVKLTPTPHDDIAVDIILKGLWKVVKLAVDGIKAMTKAFFGNKLEDKSEEPKEPTDGQE